MLTPGGGRWMRMCSYWLHVRLEEAWEVGNETLSYLFVLFFLSVDDHDDVSRW